MNTPATKILVALDVPTADEALKLTEQLAPLGVGFKVGMQLFYAAGISLVHAIQAKTPDQRVFVDLKLHDIPTTVGKASAALVNQGVSFLNVHTLGGLEMMQAARQHADAAQAAQAHNQPTPWLIGVTILTSHTAQALQQELKIHMPLPELVVHLAKLAQQAGLNGVVCSPQEAQAIRQACGQDFLLITPGIRPTGSNADDQERLLTPRAAVQAGSNFLVIGRPITQAPDPVAAAEAILAELAEPARLS